jgi:hypothetical protein
MVETRSPFIRKRHLIHIAGFEPVTPEVLNRRLTSGLNRFSKLWGVTARRSEPDLAGDGHEISWMVETRGPNWTNTCRYTVLRWDDLMAPYVERPWLSRVVGGYRALLEFAWTGTIRRYFEANVRYGMFVLYPVFLLIGFALLGGLAGFIAGMAGIPSPGITAPLAGMLAFLLLLRFGGAFFYLDFALADWCFAADLSRRDVPGLEAVVERFTAVVAASVHDPDQDEVVVSGVSLGAVMLVEALERALAADPRLPKRRRFAFLTVGSSILKIGLHPAAERLRHAVTAVGSDLSVFWVEYQAKVDFINFFGTDPVAVLSDRTTGRPLVRAIKIREMMGVEEYARAQRNSLLLHRQFVMPNGRRHFYDFYQICFGPMPLTDRVALGEAAVAAFAEDGSYEPRRIPAAAAKPVAQSA